MDMRVTCCKQKVWCQTQPGFHNMVVLNFQAYKDQTKLHAVSLKYILSAVSNIPECSHLPKKFKMYKPNGLFLWGNCKEISLRPRRLRRKIESSAAEWKRQTSVGNSLKLPTFGGRALLLLRMIYLFIYYADADSAQLVRFYMTHSG
jgi:hypothetical protein